MGSLHRVGRQLWSDQSRLAARRECWGPWTAPDSSGTAALASSSRRQPDLLRHWSGL